MLSFLEWVNVHEELLEASFATVDWPTSIARMLIKRLGGNPEEKINLTTLLTTDGGETFKTAPELITAFKGAIEDAKAAGARRASIEKATIDLMNHERKLRQTENPMDLINHVTSIVNNALMTWDELQRKKSMEDWEKKRRPKGPTRRGPETIQDVDTRLDQEGGQGPVGPAPVPVR